MPPRKHPAPNFYAGVPLDRADQRRADTDYIDRLVNDPACVIVPVWRTKHLITAEAEAVWLRRSEAGHLLETARVSLFLGLREETAYLAVDLSHLEEPEQDPVLGNRGSFQDLRAVGPIMDRRDSAILAYARGLAHWHARHGFCGVCGSATLSEKAGHQRRCSDPDCAAVHFPRTDPAVIMLVHDGGDRCVLGRQPIWPPGMHSTLAGFVEPGESLEEAVAREIQEEVGLKVAVEDVAYHSSQPWPFPSSIMLGFHARADFGALNTADDELESAAWFTRAALRASPENERFKLPRRDSIAWRLIEDWLAEG
ncbi:NAD(+) diphosphatase [Pelagibius litoralis]|uniref:NAD(+) diphosphatase n=1 Tax=Pelagibius litoralis TaxID=374515 RepID=A0A967F186_9PROT|nr:NAD(+) diphosphatase [Pelagibius litoralis]NIA71298.1 NAD(+) diphosphatase [Pelagibius litoralis]